MTTTAISRPSDKKLAELRSALTRRPDVQAACKRAPKGLLSEVMGGFTRAIRDTPALLQCEPQTILDSLFDALDLGLVPGREGYFIQYGTRCHFQTGYKGILRLVMQGGVRKVDVREVRQGDNFSVEFGDEERIVHRMAIAGRDQAPMTHVYAVALLADGDRKREVWSRERIDQHKEQFSEAWKRAEKTGKKDSPWHTSWLAMAQKTVLLSLCKLLPQTTAMQKMLQVEAKAETDDVLDVSFSHAQDAIPHQASHEAQGDAQTPEDESEPVTLSEAAVGRLTNLGSDLKATDEIKVCQEIRRQYEETAEGTHEVAAIMAAVDDRCEEIRASRGQKSKK